MKLAGLLWTVCVVLVVISWAAPGTYGTTYTGSLSWDVTETELEATDGWAAEGTSIAWEITGELASWHYKYIISFGEGAKGSLSHIIIETTENLFTPNSLDSVVYTPEGTPEWEVGLYVPSGDNKPNPYMPGNAWGVKFEGMPDDEDLDNITIEFHSQHMPVWNDVFCVDGKHDGVYAAFWNSGFAAADPTVGPHNGSEQYHILAPNGVIPEPLTMLGVFMGLGGVGAYIRRRRKA